MVGRHLHDLHPSMIIPFQVVILPLISTFRDVGASSDQYAAVYSGYCFAYCGFGGAMTVFILTGYQKAFRTIWKKPQLSTDVHRRTFFRIIFRYCASSQPLNSERYVDLNDYLLPSCGERKSGSKSTFCSSVLYRIYVQTVGLDSYCCLLLILPC